MRIEIWLDYVCPLSYKTHENLMKVVNKLNIKDLEILYRSYRLELKQPVKDLKSLWNINEQSKTVDLNQVYKDFEKLYYIDTSNAHQLAHLAKKHRKQVEVNEYLLDAYFKDFLDISDQNVLLEIAKICDLDEKELMDAINNHNFDEAISSNLEHALLKRIKAIPHIRIDGIHKLEGYQTEEEIEMFVNNIINQNYSKSESCGDNCKRIRSQEKR